MRFRSTVIALRFVDILLQQELLTGKIAFAIVFTNAKSSYCKLLLQVFSWWILSTTLCDKSFVDFCVNSMLLKLRNIFLEFDWDNENPSKLQTFCIDIELVNNKHLLLLKKGASICAENCGNKNTYCVACIHVFEQLQQ